MIRNFFLSMFAFLAMSSASNAQVSAATDALNKTEVKDFGMGVVKSYFTYDCAGLWNNLATPTFKNFATGAVINKDGSTKDNYCAASANPLRTDITVNVKMYTLGYVFMVLNATEFTQAYPAQAAQLQVQAGDYFYDGTQRSSASGTDVFKAGTSTMARFLVRKVNGKWAIVAI